MIASYQGRGQSGGSGCQINNAVEVDKLVENEKHGYWKMTNGYLLPTSPGNMAQLADKILEEKLHDQIVSRYNITGTVLP